MQEAKKITQISREVSPQPPLSEKSVDAEKKRETAVTGVQAEAMVVPSPAGIVSEQSGGVTSPSPLLQGEVKNEMLLAIERILEEELGEMYWQLPEKTQKEIRDEGERTAKKLASIIDSIRISAGKILRVIWKWLATIPNVNHFFLEQAAKIKTDKIVALHKERNPHS